jgi:hypothetical protein
MLQKLLLTDNRHGLSCPARQPAEATAEVTENNDSAAEPAAE